MLRSKDEFQSLNEFLGNKDSVVVQTENKSENDTNWYTYVEDMNDNFEYQHELAADKIKDTYNDIGNTFNMTRKYALIGGVVVVGLFAWKLIGKDIYYLSKGK